MDQVAAEWLQGRASLGAAGSWTAAEMRLVADVGFALAEQGRNGEAITVFEGLAALAPATGYFQSALGALRLRAGQAARAVEHLDAALAADPTDLTALVNRAEARMQLGEREAALAQSGEQARSLWRIRESIPEAQFANVKHDISLPISKIPEFTQVAGDALARAFSDAQIFCFGHVGDGNLHYNVGPPSLVDKRDAVNRIVYDAVERLGGSISAEHGLGQLKREAIRHHKSALELELMKKVKAALDPGDLMNPGKVL
jgi:FAD/FMN-containing dehydrogenase